MKLTAKKIMVVFITAFIISVITLREDFRNPIMLIQVAFVREVVSFFIGLSMIWGMIFGNYIVNRYFNKKVK